MSTEAILKEVAKERVRQDAKWGEQNHPDGTGQKDLKEVAIDARILCDEAAAAGELCWAQILEEEFWEAIAEEDPVKLRTELIQVAAVCAAWVAAIDRRGGK